MLKTTPMMTPMMTMKVRAVDLAVCDVTVLDKQTQKTQRAGGPGRASLCLYSRISSAGGQLLAQTSVRSIFYVTNSLKALVICVYVEVSGDPTGRADCSRLRRVWRIEFRLNSDQSTCQTNFVLYALRLYFDFTVYYGLLLVRGQAYAPHRTIGASS